MGALRNLFRKASTEADYSLFNDVTYSISRDEGDRSIIKVYRDGSLIDGISAKNVVISNDNLASKWFYNLFDTDRIPTMSECKISESAGIYYIRCNNWVPSDGDYPPRVVKTSKLREFFTSKDQIYVYIDNDVVCKFLTVDGEYGDVDINNTIWKSAPDRNKWLLCRATRISQTTYFLDVLDEVPTSVDIIVSGKWMWDEERQSWKST